MKLPAVEEVNESGEKRWDIFMKSSFKLNLSFLSYNVVKTRTVNTYKTFCSCSNILTLSTIGKLIHKVKKFHVDCNEESSFFKYLESFFVFQRYYKRLDKLQEDLYSFFENARTHRSDTEVSLSE